MTYLLAITFCFLSYSLSAQSYYVLHVVGKVTTVNNDTVRIQNQYSEGQEFNFSDSSALIVFLNEKVGKVVLKPSPKKNNQSHQKQSSDKLRAPQPDKRGYLFSEIITLSGQELLPLTNTTFTRGNVGVVTQLEDFQTYFEKPYLLLDTIAIDYNPNYFPTDQNHYFFLKNGREKKQKIPTHNGQLLVTEDLFTAVDSSYQNRKHFRSELFQHKNQIDYPITEITVVIVEGQQLEQQATMIINTEEKVNTANETELIKQVHLIFSELYGSCTKDEVKAWLYNHSLL